MSKFIAGASYPLARALIDAGLIQDDETFVKRILIDLKAGQPAVIKVEYFADDEKMVDWITGADFKRPRVEQATAAPGELR